MNTRVVTQPTEELILTLQNWWPIEGSFGVLTLVKGERRCPGCPPTSGSGAAFCVMEIGLLRLNPVLCSSLGVDFMQFADGTKLSWLLKLQLLQS